MVIAKNEIAFNVFPAIYITRFPKQFQVKYTSL